MSKKQATIKKKNVKKGPSSRIKSSLFISFGSSGPYIDIPVLASSPSFHDASNDHRDVLLLISLDELFPRDLVVIDSFQGVVMFRDHEVLLRKLMLIPLKDIKL